MNPRIRHLELLSAAPLAELREFYHRLLGLGIANETPERLTFDAGQTRLTFRRSAADEEPFYHFAFNIPENKLRAAHRWQRERTPLLPIPQTLRDPSFPDEVVHYRHWNAHSIFFFDPAGNVVEYIARHDLKNAAPGAFRSEDLLYASEIAFVVDDVTAAAAGLQDAAGIGPYRGGSEEFAALGDEHGLLLVMKRGRLISFEAPERKRVSVFPTVATVRGSRRGKHGVPGFPYEILMED